MNKGLMIDRKRKKIASTTGRKKPLVVRVSRTLQKIFGDVFDCGEISDRVHDGHLAKRRAAAGSRSAQLVTPVHEPYDAGMARSKIAISLPKDQLARVHKEVRAGRADSVSGYIAWVLAEHGRRESLRVLLRDLIDQYGEPAAKDIKWAERALRRG